MLEDTTIHNAITDKALASYFRSSGNLLEEESAVLGQAVTNLMLSGDNEPPRVSWRVFYL